MKTLDFKTNLISTEAVAAVTKGLNDIEQIDGWNVALESSDKLLTVQTTDNRISDLVLRAIRQAGYQAEPVAS